MNDRTIRSDPIVMDGAGGVKYGGGSVARILPNTKSGAL